MPLEILGPLVVAGIALVVLIVRFGANTPERLIENHDMAVNIFGADFPSAHFEEPAHIATDKRVAVLALSSPKNAIGIVMVMGSKHLTRLLTAREVEEISKTGKTGMDIVLRDFTLPDIPLAFSDPAERDAVVGMIEEHLSQTAASTRKRSTMA